MANNVDVQLPIQFQDFYVLSFGEINATSPYCGPDHIWPIGFKSCWHEKVTASLYTCEVSDNGHGGPVFTITRRSCSASPIPNGSNPSDPTDLDHEEYDRVLKTLPDIIPSSQMNLGTASSSVGPHEADVIGEVSVQDSSPLSAWKLMLEKVSDTYQEIFKRTSRFQCLCKHAKDLNFLSSMPLISQSSLDQVNSLENLLGSKRHVSGPVLIHGDVEFREFLESLINCLRDYRFGLDIKFVQEHIEKLPGIEACSGYISCKDRLAIVNGEADWLTRLTSLTTLNESVSFLISEEVVIEKQPFPSGSLSSSRLSSDVFGNVLQAHQFIYRFQEILGVEDSLSFEELENEFLCSLPNSLDENESQHDNMYDLSNESSILEIIEINCNKYMGEKLTTVHNALLPGLLNELLEKVTSVVNISNDAEVSKSKGAHKRDGAKRVKLEMLPINQLTWPEVVRRYVLVYLLIGGKLHCVDIDVSDETKLIRCLQGDVGIFCGSPTGVAGVEVDTKLLARAVNKVFGRVDTKVAEWAKSLDPVRKLATNVGAKIRNCIREALTKNPPEWARRQLEASIGKDIYKGNASGPTKKAVARVLAEAQRRLPSECGEKRTPEVLSKLILKKCQIILRHVANYDENMDLCDLIGRNFMFDDDDLKFVFGSTSTRPLDLRTVDMRLHCGAYGDSYEAFLEDVKELWVNLRQMHRNRPTLVKLVDKMSQDFESQYEIEVASLLTEYNSKNKEYTEEVEKELNKQLNSLKIPETPWESGICKVCGLNRDDANVLLCDNKKMCDNIIKKCEKEYHIYCLKPPLYKVPEDDWFCPECAPHQQNKDNASDGSQLILEFVRNKDMEEAGPLLDIVTSLEKNEYLDLEVDKKFFLLKFLCEESLNTNIIREYLDKSRAKFAKLTQQSKFIKFLGVDSDGKLYWGSPNTTNHYGIIVNQQSEKSSKDSWHLFQSEDEINNLVNYLKTNHPEKTELRDLILQWQKSLLNDHPTVGNFSIESRETKKSLVTNATRFLEAKYGSNPDLDAGPPRRKNMAKWHRCECLEPAIPSRFHCLECHETFLTNFEFELHQRVSCGGESSTSAMDPGGGGESEVLVSGSEWFSEIVPECGLKKIVGKSFDVLRHLKMNLLDIEAAVPDESRRDSRRGSEWRSRWWKFVKSANTIYEMVEAIMVFETMIKTEYIKNTWWWHWSSVSIAAKTTTMSALALRIYALDAAIDYHKTATSAAPKKRKEEATQGDDEKVKKRRKKRKDSVEKKEKESEDDKKVDEINESEEATQGDEEKVKKRRKKRNDSVDKKGTRKEKESEDDKKVDEIKEVEENVEIEKTKDFEEEIEDQKDGN